MKSYRKKISILLAGTMLLGNIGLNGCMSVTKEVDKENELSES